MAGLIGVVYYLVLVYLVMVARTNTWTWWKDLKW
jgi:hypothetical protein